MTVPKCRTALDAFLSANGLRPARARGQNFLVDQNIVEAIVREAAPTREECVLEIGTGAGVLTDVLAARAGCVVTCDIDARLQRAAQAAQTWPDSVVFLQSDILNGKHALDAEVMARWQEEAFRRGLPRLRVISNLPYSVATPVLANLLWSGIEMGDIVVLVQKEAAERFTAAPRTPAYGPMAVAVGLLAEAKILRGVPPQVFFPAPRVQSSLLRLRLRNAGRARALAALGLPALLQEMFLHRRKSLRKRIDQERLEAAGIPPLARPEEVEPEEWPLLLPRTP